MAPDVSPSSRARARRAPRRVFSAPIFWRFLFCLFPPGGGEKKGRARAFSRRLGARTSGRALCGGDARAAPLSRAAAAAAGAGSCPGASCARRRSECELAGRAAQQRSRRAPTQPAHGGARPAWSALQPPAQPPPPPSAVPRGCDDGDGRARRYEPAFRCIARRSWRGSGRRGRALGICGCHRRGGHATATRASSVRGRILKRARQEGVRFARHAHTAFLVAG